MENNFNYQLENGLNELPFEQIIHTGEVLGGIMSVIGSAFIILSVIFLFITIVSWWKTFQKAGKPGWAILIPIYNMIVTLEITKLPIWYVILTFIPIVNIFIYIQTYIKLAKSFNKSAIFGLGITFLPFIFVPILAFGKSQYIAIS